MNILKGNILKGFAAIAMLCMVGAVFATPSILNSAYTGYELAHSADEAYHGSTAGKALFGVNAFLAPEHIIVAGALITGGVAACSTGVGAVVGIPMVIGGIAL
ncbi:hypothetical protein [Methanothermococcus okinawensis]|uniref:Uncharacterized protein n=1 Tax=Methanothermococcus okinawensis (strain DSM 14208 / JCM 11175 / IH1) TaxID=647113 RepID=F8AL10_METOI|nr:hypothetical protein [Methanothermococcus okinawensis]AEH06445.1 hypothetical protein Metok_0463 [Methanothermococcus okinawensis IH1]